MAHRREFQDVKTMVLHPFKPCMMITVAVPDLEPNELPDAVTRESYGLCRCEEGAPF